MAALSLNADVYAVHPAPEAEDFRTYLERSLRDPFTLNLKDCNLLEVIRECIKVKSRLAPNYGKGVAGLIFNIKELERQYGVVLSPVQITDVFWSYFISFCFSRGLRTTTVETMCNQLRSILCWAGKYNATIAPTYDSFRLPTARPFTIALTADDVSRIAYFDVDRFYANRRSDFRETMKKVRDMFVLSCNLFQRHSDMVSIEPSHFDRNIFSIMQQKTGGRAVVDIDRYSIDARTTYRLLEQYGHRAPYPSTIGNYNYYLHPLMRDVGFTDEVRVEERRAGTIIAKMVPRWKLISSHTARRTAITVSVMRGHNVHDIRRCSGHMDLRNFDMYIRDSD